MGGLSIIKVPDPKDVNPKTALNWKTITEPKEVKKKILLHNHHHFGQAHPTPLATPEIQQLLSFGGTSSIADQLLYHNLSPSTITNHSYGQQLLAKCSTDVQEISPDISFDKMKHKYKCWPEKQAHPLLANT